jgi:hypothetical protein
MQKLSSARPIVATALLPLMACASFLLCACSGPVASKSDPVVESADSVDRHDAGPDAEDSGPTSCEVQCDQVGALCDTLCTEESDSGAQIESCQDVCAKAVLSECLPYCPGFTLPVICVLGRCTDGGMTATY